jgi:hypothetical protein
MADDFVDNGWPQGLGDVVPHVGKSDEASARYRRRSRHTT